MVLKKLEKHHNLVRDSINKRGHRGFKLLCLFNVYKRRGARKELLLHWFTKITLNAGKTRSSMDNAGIEKLMLIPDVHISDIKLLFSSIRNSTF